MIRKFSEVIFQSINSTYFSGCIDKLLLIIINSNCKITISKKNKLSWGIFFEYQAIVSDAGAHYTMWNPVF